MTKSTSPTTNIKLFEKGKVVYNHTYKRKASVLPSVQIRLSKSRGISRGVCTVTYKPGWWNRFDFLGYRDFKTKFRPCVEKQLLEFIYE